MRLEPRTKGIYDKIKQKATPKYLIPGTHRNRVAAETIRSWIKDYRQDGDALFPKNRSDKGKSHTLSTKTEDVLIEIKGDNLAFSVKQVIEKAKKLGKIDKN